MIRALSNLFSRPKRADPIRQGFTLIEVITAVVLIAALAAVAIPVFMQRTRASRAEADVGELEALRTGLLLFYTDVGRIPATLEYLYKIPASPTDICGVSIPTLNQNRFRGPYVTRQIYQLGGGLTSYPLATGDSVETILTPTTINGQSVAQIAL
jgi:prepilin-type N-terminal cleavage/methylation domain-containing protein